MTDPVPTFPVTTGPSEIGFAHLPTADERKAARRLRTRETCADRGHPPVTWNPTQRTSWCACGERATPGQCPPDHSVCCGELAQR